MLGHPELHALFGIPAVIYNQIGNGQSTHLPNKLPSFWTVDLFVDELDVILKHLSIQDDFRTCSVIPGEECSPRSLWRRGHRLA
jgi:hypothetical protein